MATQDWNWRLPPDPQDYPWDCSACSLAWCLRTIGRTETEQDVIAGLGPARINATYGLLNATGEGMVAYLAELGINASNSALASWNDVQAAAGYQPMVIGGRQWCHWVAVRMGSDTVYRESEGMRELPPMLALMNPANGYRGVEQTMIPDDFARLGSFSAVWFDSW